jgi:Protein of unknown function (DUF4232)
MRRCDGSVEQRRMSVVRVLLALVATLAVGAGVAQGRDTTIVFCKGTQLAGSFKAVYGSAGAGNIVYRLTLKNVSAKACSLTGLPRGQLLGKTGKKLPTHVRAAFPGALTAILVTLAPGRSSHATARFSPDVPGAGEQKPGQCEPTAYRLRISQPSRGNTAVKMIPPTPVCEHGGMSFSAYGN